MVVKEIEIKDLQLSAVKNGEKCFLFFISLVIINKMNFREQIYKASEISHK